MYNLIKNTDIIRVKRSGVQGAALLNVDIYRCETGEIMLLNSLCLENGDAANTINTRMGIVRNGLFYPHKTNAAVAAGASLEIDRRLICREHESARVEITPSGADTEFTVTLEGWRLNCDTV